MYCRNCGTFVPPFSQACPRCAVPVTADSLTSTPPGSAPPVTIIEQRDNSGAGRAMITLGIAVSFLGLLVPVYFVFGGVVNTAFQEQSIIQLGILVCVFALAALIVPGAYYANRGK